MQTTRKGTPGQEGAKKLLDQYGAYLVCARSRYGRQGRKRFKTAASVIEEASWSLPPASISGETLMDVQVVFEEAAVAVTGQQGRRQVEPGMPNGGSS